MINVVRIFSHNAMLVLAKNGSRIGKCCSGKSFKNGVGSKRNKWMHLLMCANTDQAIKYYQDATIGNET